MFLWTRPFVTEILLGLMTASTEDAPWPSLREWNLEFGVLVFGILPLAAATGQLYLRLVASISVPAPWKKYCPPAVYATLVQMVLADAVLAVLLWSMSRYVLRVSDTTALLADFTAHHHWQDWGRNGAFLVFMVRLFATLLGLTAGEAFFPLCLTGGIACGKSTFAPLLQERAGFSMIDADKIGHLILLPQWHVDLNHEDSLVQPKDSVYVQILEAFGADENQDKKSNGVNEHHPLLHDNGDQTIDRAKLGARIFANPNDRQTLNAITHPRIFKCLMKQMTRRIYMGSSDIKYVCAEIPLLFESKNLIMRHVFGMVLCVACRPSQQFERLQKRNPELTKEECQKRIESQMSIVDKVKLADIVLWNEQDFAPASDKKTTKKEESKESKEADKQQQEAIKQAQMQQVEKAMLVLKYRTKGILEITLVQLFMFLTSATMLSVSFKLFMASYYNSTTTSSSSENTSDADAETGSEL